MLIKQLLAQGFIGASNNPFSLMVILIRKKDEGWMLYIDYNAHNMTTIKDRFLIPTIDDLLGELNGATIFSKLDVLDQVIIKSEFIL